jgi:hypothetical protein
MCPYKYELMRENTINKKYPYGYVIDFAGNIIPLLEPKLLIDFSTNLEIEYEEINFCDDYILIEN